MDTTRTVQWQLTAEEAQLIINALSVRPYAEVAELLPRLVTSARQQLAPPASP